MERDAVHEERVIYVLGGEIDIACDRLLLTRRHLFAATVRILYVGQASRPQWKLGAFSYKT
jgi:hypothetical protein